MSSFQNAIVLCSSSSSSSEDEDEDEVDETKQEEDDQEASSSSSSSSAADAHAHAADAHAADAAAAHPKSSSGSAVNGDGNDDEHHHDDDDDHYDDDHDSIAEFLSEDENDSAAAAAAAADRVLLPQRQRSLYHQHPPNAMMKKDGKDNDNDNEKDDDDDDDHDDDSDDDSDDSDMEIQVLEVKPAPPPPPAPAPQLLLLARSTSSSNSSSNNYHAANNSFNYNYSNYNYSKKRKLLAPMNSLDDVSSDDDDDDDVDNDAAILKMSSGLTKKKKCQPQQPPQSQPHDVSGCSMSSTAYTSTTGTTGTTTTTTTTRPSFTTTNNNNQHHSYGSSSRNVVISIDIDDDDDDGSDNDHHQRLLLSSVPPKMTPRSATATATATSSASAVTPGTMERPYHHQQQPAHKHQATTTKPPPPKNPYLKSTRTAPPGPSTSTTTTTTTSTTLVQSSSVPVPVPLPVPLPASSSLSSRSPNTNITNTKPLYHYPRLLDQTKSYPDVRAQYCIVFWKAARKLVHHSHQGRQLDRMVSRLVYLALEVEFPIRSPDEYCERLKGRGSGSGSGSGSGGVADLKDLLQQEHADRIKTSPGGGVAPTGNTITNTSFLRGPQRTFYTIAEAALVAMLDHVLLSTRTSSLSFPLSSLSDSELEQHLTQKSSWASLATLIPQIDERLKSIISSSSGGGVCPGRLTRVQDADNGAAHYQDPSTRSAEYKQIQKLFAALQDNTMPYLRKHKAQGGRPFIELTTRGYHKALQVRSRLFPAPGGHYRTSKYLYAGDEPLKFRGICLAVDRKEGGGEAHNLHSMCNKLDMTGLPYFVGTLSIGDYCFFAGNKLLPLLVERKSVEDVVISIADGRWTSQKKRMYQGQFIFGYSTCRMAYIIEGKVERQQVTGGYIGHEKYQTTKQEFDQLIESLETEGFDVLRTSSPENSMFELSRWASRVLQEAKGGELEVKYTYQEFKSLVKKIPPEVDFSRMAKDAMQQRLAARRERERQAILEELSDDLQPIALDTRLKGTATTARQHNRYLLAPSSSSRASSAQSTTSISPTDVTISQESTTSGARASSSADYSKWTKKALQQQCSEWGLPKSGAIADLILRLKGPRRPQVLIDRAAAGQYSPKNHDTGPCALLVGLVLEQHKPPRETSHQGASADDSFAGSLKEELYTQAESLNITKNPFSGGTTQTGPFHYDGWSNMTGLLQGDPPLVCRLRGGRHRLTTCGPISGLPVAKAIHRWCHAHNKCSCEDLGYVYKEEDWY